MNAEELAKFIGFIEKVDAAEQRRIEHRGNDTWLNILQSTYVYG